MNSIEEGLEDLSTKELALLVLLSNRPTTSDRLAQSRESFPVNTPARQLGTHGNGQLPRDLRPDEADDLPGFAKGVKWDADLIKLSVTNPGLLSDSEKKTVSGWLERYPEARYQQQGAIEYAKILGIQIK